MKRYGSPLLLLISTGTAWGQPRLPVSAAGPTLASFIPPGYKILAEGRATGDLNGDGRPDVALALGPLAEENTPAADHLPPRLLLVLWRTATGYQLVAQSRQAILCKECGGAFGDPLAGIAIGKGVVSIYHHGGSSWRWSLTGKFRYQQGDFYQIGETYNLTQVNAEECAGAAGHRPGDEYRDRNLATGDFQSIKVSAQCKMLENRRGRQPVRPLRKLADYKPAP